MQGDEIVSTSIPTGQCVVFQCSVCVIQCCVDIVRVAGDGVCV